VDDCVVEHKSFLIDYNFNMTCLKFEYVCYVDSNAEYDLICAYDPTIASLALKPLPSLKYAFLSPDWCLYVCNCF